MNGKTGEGYYLHRSSGNWMSLLLPGGHLRCCVSSGGLGSSRIVSDTKSRVILLIQLGMRAFTYPHPSHHHVGSTQREVPDMSR